MSGPTTFYLHTEDQKKILNYTEEEVNYLNKSTTKTENLDGDLDKVQEIKNYDLENFSVQCHLTMILVKMFVPTRFYFHSGLYSGSSIVC